MKSIICTVGDSRCGDTFAKEFFKKLKKKKIVNNAGVVIKFESLSPLELISLYSEWLMDELASSGRLN